MASATSSISSSIYNNRIYNLSFTHSSISLTTTNFPQRPISHKPFNLNLNSQSFNLCPIPLQILHPPFASLDEFQVSQQENSESEPQTETFEKPQQEEEQKVTISDDAGRLYVGNLPFSITSSQLAEIFAEAGTVVSVEVFFFSFILHNLFVIVFFYIKKNFFICLIGKLKKKKWILL